MKKYFIIAVAALVASAACSKVETVDNRPDKKISFEVANYSGQTKAAEDPGSVLAETDNFKSKAWLHANGTNPGTDFFGVEVTPGTDATSFVETVTYNGSNAWEPELEYFWPKGAGSYINFVSWFATNSKAPSTVSETVMNWGTSAAPMTIVTDDNFLFADEAWRYTDNVDPATYGYNGVTKGVPTLFHHALAKVKFNLRLSTETQSTKSIWDVEVKTVTFNVGNNGYLALVNEDKNTTGTQPWKVGTTYSTGAAATSANVGWARPTSGATLETIVEKGSEAASVTKEFEKLLFEDFQPTSATTGTPYKSDPQVLLAERTVMPQLIDGGVVTFGMTFTIKIYHDADEDGTKDGPAFSNELITIAATTNLHDLVGSIDEWKMNTKYTYNVTIDPVGRKVLFDPAVAEWNTVETAETEIYHAD